MSRPAGATAREDGRSSARWLAVLALFLVYAAPLFLASALQAPSHAPAAGAPAALLGRLFPGVPGGWVVARLAALAAAVWLAAGALRGTADVGASEPVPGPVPAAGSARRRAAAGLALLSLASVPLLGAAGPWLRIAWLALLAAPALLLRVGAPRARPRAERLALAACLGLAALWLAWRLGCDLLAPRAADPVDTWLGSEWLEIVVRDGWNVLTRRIPPGQTALNLGLQGALVPGLRTPPSFALLQGIHAGWTALAGAGVGLLAARWISPAAGPVATAALLFSPFALLLPLVSAPVFAGPLETTAVLLLLERALRGRSAAALAALGPAAGVAATNPALAPLAGAALAVAALAGVRRRLGAAPLLAAGAGFAAALLPSAPGPGELSSMLHEMSGARADWAGLESVLLGRRTPFDVPALWQAGRAGPLDVPLGALLAPFAIARQPLRLWGDALQDPLTAALVALGVLLALRRARRAGDARLALALLALATLPAFVSSYDRPSLTRLFGAPVLWALFAASGFDALRARLLPARPARAAGIFVALAAAGGTLLFDAVNPRILPASVLHAAVEAGRGSPTGSLALVTWPRPHDLSWLRVERVARELARPPLAWLRLERDRPVLVRAREAGVEAFLWSPALEAEAGLSARACRRWPDATLLQLLDRSGSVAAFGVRPPGSSFRSRTPPPRRREQRCPPPPPASD